MAAITQLSTLPVIVAKIPWLAYSSSDPVGEVHLQLRVDGAPILAAASPFFRDIHHSQLQHFQKAVVCRENGF
jgi:hypothetical protein